VTTTTTDAKTRELERKARQGDGNAAFELVQVLARAGQPLTELVKWLPSYDSHDSDAKTLHGTPLDRGYVGWAPGDAGLEYPTWKDFYHGPSEKRGSILVDEGGYKGCDDDLNIVVDFYFRTDHDSRTCTACQGCGYNPETAALYRSFYRWDDQLTQDEVDELVRAGRLWDLMRGEKHPTADKVNAWSRRGLGHDGINQSILVKVRATRLGFYGLCPTCNGNGSERLSEDRLALYLWLILPRKGASRGVEIKSVQVSELAEVREFLRRSWRKHEQHFKWVTG